MKSESPKKAILASPLTSEDVGGIQELGQLVAAASMSGQTVNEFAEQALVQRAMSDFRLSREDAEQLLRGLESSQGSNR